MTPVRVQPVQQQNPAEPPVHVHLNGRDFYAPTFEEALSVALRGVSAETLDAAMRALSAVDQGSA